MEGVLIYLAIGHPNKMGDPNNMTSENYAYILGILLPEIVKLGVIKTKEDFDKLFERCDEKDILTYEQFLEYSKDPQFTEDINSTANLQSTKDINCTINPNLRRFIKSKYVNLRNPLWQGVFCHLIGDKIFYLDDFNVEKLNDEQLKNGNMANDISRGYNLLDKFIQKKFHILKYLTPELKKIFKIDFSDLEENSELKESLEYFNAIRPDITRSRLLAGVVDIKNEKELVDYFERMEASIALRKRQRQLKRQPQEPMGRD